MNRFWFASLARGRLINRSIVLGTLPGHSYTVCQCTAAATATAAYPALGRFLDDGDDGDDEAATNSDITAH